MKKYLTTLCLSFFGWALMAQVTPPVTVANSAGIAQQISDLFGSNINATTSQIQTFFDDQLIDQNSFCGWPDGMLLNYDEDFAQFAWAPVPGAQKYHIKYLNLLTNASGHVSFNPAGPYVLPVPDGLYVFTFQAQCGPNSRGPLGIIIADKDIMITISPNFDCRCRQVSSTLIQDGWQIPAPAQFLLILDDPESSEGEDVVMEFTTELIEIPDGQEIGFTVYPFCGVSGSISEDNSIFYPDFDPDGTIYLNGGFMEISMDNAVNAYVRMCGKSPNNQNINPRNLAEAGELSSNEIRISPNPAVEYFTVQGPSSQNGSVQLSISDLNGQLIQQSTYQFTPGEAWTITAKFPAEIPSGLYLTLLEVDGQQSFHKLVKQ